MTTLTANNQTGRTVPHGSSFGRVLNSEWIKFRSLRSTVILLFSAVVMMIGIGTLGAWGIASAAEDAQPSAPGMIHTMPSGGLSFAQLLIGALAVLLISSEFGTGMIRSTMIAVPKRIPALAAKGVVISLIAYIVGTVAALATYFAIQPILATQEMEFALDAEGVLGSIFSIGLYLSFVALIGLALGALLRNSAGGIVTLIALLMVVPTALDIIPGEFASDIAKYLPSNAGTQLIATQVADDALTQFQGGLVMGAWAVIPLIAAIVVLKRRDV